ncbi:hypothetical protein NPIL_70831 [Nephila pilipes]|uniref:Uncharacterized protein n=1 Tax=Nephila pilipes TaxID=299642 RepID=A0A8X6MVS4_NEPPI|nr:hypothetical protein NPIL_70831 [Nephila pilipes]
MACAQLDDYDLGGYDSDDYLNEYRFDMMESDSADFEFSSEIDNDADLESLNKALQCCPLNEDEQNPAPPPFVFHAPAPVPKLSERHFGAGLGRKAPALARCRASFSPALNVLSVFASFLANFRRVGGRSGGVL